MNESSNGGRTFRRLAALTFDLATRFEVDALNDYQVVERKTGFWGLIDLRSSAYSRAKYGEEHAFRRAIVLTELVKRLAVGYGYERSSDQESERKVRVFKELGDGLLVYSSAFRPLLEMLVVLDGVQELWRIEVDRGVGYPALDSRSAVTFGEALVHGEDFLGSPIDHVARLSGFKSINPSAIATVSDKVRQQTEGELSMDYPFASYGESNQLPAELFKLGERRLWASELLVDRVKRRDFESRFETIWKVLGEP